MCSTCEADYFVDGERVTLLGAFEDPFGFAEANVGRLLTWESMRWLGAGKFSQRPGSTCSRCQTEFDDEDDYLRLVRTSHPILFRLVGTLQTFEDWHRIARGLPRVDEEDAFEASFEAAIRAAYLEGKLCYDDRNTFWKGWAIRLSDETEGTLIANPEELSFGGRLRRDKTPLELIISAKCEGSVLRVHVRGKRELLEFDVTETELPAHLASGDRIIELDSQDLAARINAVVWREKAPGSQL
jgi:uncharacterized C2H2 Zn-finger protein